MQMIALGWIKLRFQRQAGKANHAIQWRTQLVRHIGQELRFNARRLLGTLFGQIQLDVLDLHLFQGFT